MSRESFDHIWTTDIEDYVTHQRSTDGLWEFRYALRKHGYPLIAEHVSEIIKEVSRIQVSIAGTQSAWNELQEAKWGMASWYSDDATEETAREMCQRVEDRFRKEAEEDGE